MILGQAGLGQSSHATASSNKEEEMHSGLGWKNGNLNSVLGCLHELGYGYFAYELGDDHSTLEHPDFILESISGATVFS